MFLLFYPALPLVSGEKLLSSLTTILYVLQGDTLMMTVMLVLPQTAGVVGIQILSQSRYQSVIEKYLFYFKIMLEQAHICLELSCQ